MAKVKLHRKTELVNGDVLLIYTTSGSSGCHWLLLNEDRHLHYGSAQRISAEYPTLHYSEVQRAFGQLPLPAGVEFRTSRCAVVVPAKLGKAGVKAAHRAVMEWLHDGLERVAALHTERDFRGWLWKDWERELL